MAIDFETEVLALDILCGCFFSESELKREAEAMISKQTSNGR